MRLKQNNTAAGAALAMPIIIIRMEQRPTSPCSSCRSTPSGKARTANGTWLEEAKPKVVVAG